MVTMSVTAVGLTANAPPTAGISCAAGSRTCPDHRRLASWTFLTFVFRRYLAVAICSWTSSWLCRILRWTFIGSKVDAATSHSATYGR